MAALTTRTDNTATNVVSDPISSYNSRDVFFSSALSVFISPNFLFLFGSELLLVTEQFRKVLNKSLSFLILFLFQLLLFQKVLIGFEFFKFCDFWLFAIFKSFSKCHGRWNWKNKIIILYLNTWCTTFMSVVHTIKSMDLI